MTKMKILFNQKEAIVDSIELKESINTENLHIESTLLIMLNGILKELRKLNNGIEDLKYIMGASKIGS